MTDGEIFRLLRHKDDYIDMGGDIQAAFEVHGGRHCCFFEETTTREDWRTNLSFIPKGWPSGGGMVHGGYLRAYLMNREIAVGGMTAARERAEEGAVPLFAGWSMGGALALLAALDWAEVTGERPEVVTFGSPKVAFGRRARRLMLGRLGEVRQHVIPGDLPPLMPPFPLWGHVAKVTDGGLGGIVRRVLRPSETHGLYGELLD